MMSQCCRRPRANTAARTAPRGTIRSIPPYRSKVWRRGIQRFEARPALQAANLRVAIKVEATSTNAAMGNMSVSPKNFAQVARGDKRLTQQYKVRAAFSPGDFIAAYPRVRGFQFERRPLKGCPFLAEMLLRSHQLPTSPEFPQLRRYRQKYVILRPEAMLPTVVPAAVRARTVAG
jgi:hypothetical protein